MPVERELLHAKQLLSARLLREGLQGGVVGMTSTSPARPAASTGWPTIWSTCSASWRSYCFEGEPPCPRPSTTSSAACAIPFWAREGSTASASAGLTPDADENRSDVLERLRRSAEPFSIILVEEDQPRMA